MGKIYYDPVTKSYSDKPPQIETTAEKPNLPDGVSRGPDSVFASIDEAAIDGMYFSRTRPKQFIEYGGWIIKLPAGGFTYIGIEDSSSAERYGRKGSAGSVCLGSPPEGTVASFHTHPRRSSQSPVVSSQEYFSEGDQDFAKWAMGEGVSPAYIYLHTPYGRVRRYDPVKNVSVTLRGPPLPNEGRGGL